MGNIRTHSSKLEMYSTVADIHSRDRYMRSKRIHLSCKFGNQGQASVQCSPKIAQQQYFIMQQAE